MPFSCVTIGGRLTRDPELRSTSNGNQLAKFSLAFGETWKGEEKPAFIEVTVWGRNAEFVANNFHKGQECVVIGRLEMDQWQDREGQKRSQIAVNADSVKFVGPKQERSEPAREQKRDTYQPEYSRSGPEGEDIPF